MPKAKKLLPLLILAALFSGPDLSSAGRETVEVLTVEGLVWVSKPGKRLRELSPGDLLVGGDQIRTEKKSRIEIKLADDGVIRFDELTTFKLAIQEPGGKKSGPRFNIHLIQGNTWANVSQPLSDRERFTLSARTAVAWSRGTIYRMSIPHDQSVQLKVYKGEVVVESMQLSASAKKRTSETPTPVGPEVKTPWTHIVGPMQQLIIRPDSEATKPFRFSITSDRNEWVRWNQKRDASESHQAL